MTWIIRYMYLKITLIYPSTTTTAGLGRARPRDPAKREGVATNIARVECARARALTADASRRDKRNCPRARVAVVDVVSRAPRSPPPPLLGVCVCVCARARPAAMEGKGRRRRRRRNGCARRLRINPSRRVNTAVRKIDCLICGFYASKKL